MLEAEFIETNYVNLGIGRIHYNDFMGNGNSITLGSIRSVKYIDSTHAVVNVLGSAEVHCKQVNGEWFFHSDSGPSFICFSNKPEYYFFHEGINYKIEDMPIADEVKMFLLLKYTLVTNDWFYIYN